MNRLYKWLFKPRKTTRAATLIILIFFTGLVLRDITKKERIPIKITTPIVNCDNQIKVLADKIDEQGQLIEAYKHRLSMYSDLFGG